MTSMRVTATLKLIGVLAFGLSGCSSLKPQANWTLMVYMNAKNDLECAALDNLSQMGIAGSRSDLNILVELGRPVKHHPCHAKEWSGVRRFRVETGMDVDGGTVLPETNMGSGQTLAEFVKWGMHQYPARHYMLVVWGHGYGYRFEFDVHAPLSELILRPDTIGGIRSVSYDPQFDSYLYIGDMADSLAGLLGKRKLDILGFDSCLMGGMENAYAFRHVARIMVASEELIPNAGWNYAELLSRMIASGDAAAPRLVSWMMQESYRTEYQQQRLKTTLSAIDLNQVEESARRLSTLSEQMMLRLKEPGSDFVDTINRIRLTMCNYGRATGNTNPVDLQLFLERLAASTENDSAVKSAANAVLDAMRPLVIATYKSRASAIANFGSNGLSIYFPPNLARWNRDLHDEDGYNKAICQPPRNHPVAFVCDQKWADFLLAYLAALPPLATPLLECDCT